VICQGDLRLVEYSCYGFLELCNNVFISRNHCDGEEQQFIVAIFSMKFNLKLLIGQSIDACLSLCTRCYDRDGDKIAVQKEEWRDIKIDVRDNCANIFEV